MLALSAHLPEIEVGAGHTLVEEGQRGGSVWVLVSGSLQILKGGVPVNTITEPGALVGEVSALLGVDHGATVVTTETTRLRCAVDGQALLLDDPTVTRLLAVTLAERLNHVTSYLVDVTHQYVESPGLTMVADVLHHLVHRQGPTARPGSQRDPDPEY